jgi:hypothetical protein
MARWRVDIIRKHAEHLGTVEAPNASEAILEAIKSFEIPPEQQNRIAVEKMTENRDQRLARQRSPKQPADPSQKAQR